MTGITTLSAHYLGITWGHFLQR